MTHGAPDSAVLVLDVEGHIRQWSDGAEALLGCAAADPPGRMFTSLALADSPKALDAALRAARERSPVEEEWWCQRADGRRFRALAVLTALVDRDGTHTGFVATIHDRTDPLHRTRRLSEEESTRLLESEERFARFAEHLPGLAWIKDLEGRYVYLNHAATRAFGAAREVITGRTDAELFPPDTAWTFREHDRRALAGGAGIQVIEFLRDPQGIVRHSIVSKFPIPDASGRPHLLGGIAIDITERVQAEEALRRADRRKDEFLATLSHELRNPLAPIRNALHILRLSGPGERADRVHEMLDHQMARLIRLVDDLLELSRISGGKIELQKEPVDLAQVIQSAVDTSYPVIDGGSHQLVISLEEPIALVADPIRLAQVISNLLNNAAKYTREGGHIWVTARRENEVAVISIRDDGMGIPADMLPRVFDMFAQVDRTLKRAQGGLGIGLALAQNLVQLHGGHIEALSAGLDQGSEFVVRLPLSERRSEPREPADFIGDQGMTITPQRILVVDDSKDGADSLGMVLKMMGAEADVVYDGPSALEAIRAKHPATVLLDIGMPGMDGYEVAAAIRQDPALADVKLIALTGWGSEEERRRSREAGFNDHWVKPVDPARLRVLLSEANGDTT